MELYLFIHLFIYLKAELGGGDVGRRAQSEWGLDTMGVGESREACCGPIEKYVDKPLFMLLRLPRTLSTYNYKKKKDPAYSLSPRVVFV